MSWVGWGLLVIVLYLVRNRFEIVSLAGEINKEFIIQDGKISELKVKVAGNSHDISETRDKVDDHVNNTHKGRKFRG